MLRCQNIFIIMLIFMCAMYIYLIYDLSYVLHIQFYNRVVIVFDTC